MGHIATKTQKTMQAIEEMTMIRMTAVLPFASMT